MNAIDSLIEAQLLLISQVNSTNSTLTMETANTQVPAAVATPTPSAGQQQTDNLATELKGLSSESVHRLIAFFSQMQTTTTTVTSTEQTPMSREHVRRLIEFFNQLSQHGTLSFESFLKLRYSGASCESMAQLLQTLDERDRKKAERLGALFHQLGQLDTTKLQTLAKELQEAENKKTNGAGGAASGKPQGLKAFDKLNELDAAGLDALAKELDGAGEKPKEAPAQAPAAAPSKEPAAPEAAPVQEPAAPAVAPAAPAQEPTAPTAAPVTEPAVPAAAPAQEPTAPATAPAQEPAAPAKEPEVQVVAKTEEPKAPEEEKFTSASSPVTQLSAPITEAPAQVSEAKPVSHRIHLTFFSI